MTKETRPPARVLELQVEIDAPIERVWAALTEGAHIAGWFVTSASVDRLGAGGQVSLAWTEVEGMAWTTRVEDWEPNRHLSWVDDSGAFGEGAVVRVDYYLSTEAGRTRVRLVQSGFGESAGWDDFFEGTEAGWAYFLRNLRHYVQVHFGHTRRMIARRLKVTIGRELAWQRVLSSAGLLAAAAGIEAGAVAELDLGGAKPVRCFVEMVLPPRAIAFRIAELDDALLFVEFEAGGDTFHLGLWLSVYDSRTAAAIEAPALAKFGLLETALADR